MTNLTISMVVIFTIYFQIIFGIEEGNYHADLNDIKNKLDQMTNQIMLQQFYAEQRVRSEGQSGIHQIRLRHGGTKNYFSETHSGSGAAAMHNHGNNIRTVGLGEFSAVLNGVEFRTRHNDYRLFMPSDDSKELHATKPIPFPEVPPEVSNMNDINAQIDEMKEWFKAWRDQDHTVRDYRNYFKAVLCYLEGAWTKTGKNIEEPFASDRHFLDAETWAELHRKLMFHAYSGSKNLRENLGYLPLKIIDVVNNSVPIFAQWNYRILCHPLKKHLSTKKLRLVEDVSTRMMEDKTLTKHKMTRQARFQVISGDIEEFEDKPTSIENLLDVLMAEIPGKDNYKGEIVDPDLKGPKDVSRYHRWFKLLEDDAFGLDNSHRGYNDPTFFGAMTTQENIAGLNLEKCSKTKGRKKTCSKIEQKWTYAIPLEIIYLTPLSRWNPYNLAFHGEFKRNDPLNPVIANGRRGKCDAVKEAYDGTSGRYYYITPSEFYLGSNIKSSADTTKRGVCVLDTKGQIHKVNAAGVQVFFDEIEGVGKLRQRYPIYPVHGEGSSVWKELNALREDIFGMNMTPIAE